MIEGVTVLSTSVRSISIVEILVIAGMLSIDITLLFFPFAESAKGFMVTSALICLTLAGIGILKFRCEEEVYKVMVDDTVSWIEFNEKYEVIEQDGEIVTIKLKEKK